MAVFVSVKFMHRVYLMFSHKFNCKVKKTDYYEIAKCKIDKIHVYDDADYKRL